MLDKIACHIYLFLIAFMWAYYKVYVKSKILKHPK